MCTQKLKPDDSKLKGEHMILDQQNKLSTAGFHFFSYIFRDS